MARAVGGLRAGACLIILILSASHQMAAQEQAASLAIRAEMSSDGAISPAETQTVAPSPRSSLVVPLYVSFAAMQVLDMHSTQLALNRGGVELNPLIRRIVGSPVATAAMKAGATAGIIIVSEKLRKHHPVAAVLVMVTLNSAYATIVSHNYSIARR